jgi:hypothetical protein
MHGPDLATRFQILTTLQGFVWIPQDGDLVKMISAWSGAPLSRRCDSA